VDDSGEHWQVSVFWLMRSRVNRIHSLEIVYITSTGMGDGGNLSGSQGSGPNGYAKLWASRGVSSSKSFGEPISASPGAARPARHSMTRERIGTGVLPLDKAQWKR